MNPSEIVSEDRDLLRRFEYWSASIVRDLNHPGSVVIRVLRANVKHSNDLRPAERAELYAVIVPRLERMIESVLDQGPIAITQQWVVNALYLMPEERGRTSSELYPEYHRALNAASA